MQWRLGVSTVLVILGSVCAAQAQETVTFRSLLNEMDQVGSLAEWPNPEYRLSMASSYDRRSRTPSDPAGWFANHDWGGYLRIEKHEGHDEYVIMDHHGPGALVRFWMPDKRTVPPYPAVDTKIRIYFDGSNAPAIEGNMLDLFNGASLVPPPFGEKSLSSSVSYLPIPFAKSCKITLDEKPFFYQLTYRAYPADTRVRTFSMKDFRAAHAEAARVGQELLSGPAAPPGHTIAVQAEIKAGDSVAADLPRGAGAVRELSLKLGSYKDPQVTRSLVLAMKFDGEQTVWVPVGALFGTGVGLNPFQTFERAVSAAGTMTVKWVMPYRKRGRVRLINYGRAPVEADLHVITGKYRWDKRTMYFHGSWRQQYPVRTRPYSDWNYLTVQGKGVYAGDTLTVFNPVKRWWGEGDEKIWVDHESFPSLFGTGTEDYYGYSWGGRNRAFYEEPFHAQVRVQNFNRTNPDKAPFVGDTKGISTEIRTRQLDAIPFEKELKFDMEVWHWADVNMDYAAATFWYAFPGAKSNRAPEPEEAKRVAPGLAASDLR